MDELNKKEYSGKMVANADKKLPVCNQIFIYGGKKFKVQVRIVILELSFLFVTEKCSISTCRVG